MPSLRIPDTSILPAAGGVGGVLATDRLQLRQRLQGRVRADRLVGLNRVLALARLDGDADDLVREAAGVGRLGGEPVRALREAVHVGTRDLELVADL